MFTTKLVKRIIHTKPATGIVLWFVATLSIMLFIYPEFILKPVFGELTTSDVIYEVQMRLWRQRRLVNSLVLLISPASILLLMYLMEAAWLNVKKEWSK